MKGGLPLRSLILNKAFLIYLFRCETILRIKLRMAKGGEKMNYFKRIITAATMVSMLLLPFAPVVEAAQPHATGQIEYNAYGLERYASFDVKQTSTNCTTS